MTDIAIATMTRADLDLALEWAAAEGWNPGLNDAALFHAVDPEGFLMARVDGEPAASISVVAYGESFGFLGLYIARPEFRGRGIGWALWQAGMARLGDRTVGLDGVVAQQANYRKSGFALAHRNVRYEGVSRADMPADPRLARIGQGILPSIRDYDRSCFPAPRDDFVAAWTRARGHVGYALVEDGDILGYGVVRPCRAGYKIGPLFAQDEHAADLIFRALASEVKGETLALDPPEPNEAALDLAERHDLSPVFETARMYRGPAPDLPLHRVFGITTFELG
ncbi:GNAT family N-acetyltransferase [Alsobacter sp. SYSU M60028]|uniref:GNAT family N-acetyltransferase n=1 Tax=Alsobacter ponti TaxID=2962936 RepID=A0ABT1L9W3_9HYPH|nr:GNAT family N-acetyltransferase [Alsobacter ponti]MCP8938265.1 GNAT family N-acetyltransferase [Alsobacter ponti]